MVQAPSVRRDVRCQPFGITRRFKPSTGRQFGQSQGASAQRRRLCATTVEAQENACLTPVSYRVIKLILVV